MRLPKGGKEKIWSKKGNKSGGLLSFFEVRHCFWIKTIKNRKEIYVKCEKRGKWKRGDGNIFCGESERESERDAGKKQRTGRRKKGDSSVLGGRF